MTIFEIFLYAIAILLGVEAMVILARSIGVSGVIRVEKIIPVRAPKLTDKYRGQLDVALRTLHGEDLLFAKKTIDAEVTRLERPTEQQVLLWAVEDEEERLKFYEDYCDAAQGLYDLATSEYFKYDDPKSKTLTISPFYARASEKHDYLRIDNR